MLAYRRRNLNPIPTNSLERHFLFNDDFSLLLRHLLRLQNLPIANVLEQQCESFKTRNGIESYPHVPGTYPVHGTLRGVPRARARRAGVNAPAYA